MKKIVISLIVLSCISTSAMAEGKVGTYIDTGFSRIGSIGWGINFKISPTSNKSGLVIMADEKLSFITNGDNTFSKAFGMFGTDHVIRDEISTNVGWQFGTEKYGGFSILPVGFKFNIDAISGTHLNGSKDDVYFNISYLFGVGYKLNLNKDFTLNARILYNDAFVSTTSENKSMEKYKPSGMSYEADVDWKLNKHLGLNFRMSYENLDDEYHLKIPYKKGFGLGFGVNFLW